MPGRGTPPSHEDDGPLMAPATVLEALPDAVVAIGRDGRIAFVNARAEELFGYEREELLGEPVQLLWAEAQREFYTRAVQRYFAKDGSMRFTSEAHGRRRDGTQFVGEMSWGVVETVTGPLLLAIGRDVSERRAAEARTRAVAAMGEHALAGADPGELASEAVRLLRTTLPVAGAAVRTGAGADLAADGPVERGLRLPIGPGDELLVAPARDLAEEEASIVSAVAHTLVTAVARLRNDERMTH